LSIREEANSQPPKTSVTRKKNVVWDEYGKELRRQEQHFQHKRRPEFYTNDDGQSIPTIEPSVIKYMTEASALSSARSLRQSVCEDLEITEWMPIIMVWVWTAQRG